MADVAKTKRKPTTKSSAANIKLPSAILRSLSTDCTAVQLLEKLDAHLGPVLDSFHTPSSRDKLVAALTAIDFVPTGDSTAIQAKKDLIDYNGHKASLDDQLKALQRHIKSDPHDGYEEQAEMMRDILQELAGWLPHLWTLGAQEGFEVDEVRKCLVLCCRTVDRAGSTSSRAEFTDINEACTCFKDTNNNVIYDADSDSIDHVLNWMWKEILVGAAARGDNKVVKVIMDTIKKLSLQGEVFNLFPQGNEKMTSDGWDLHNDHWSSAMKAAGIRLIAEHKGKK